VNGFREEEREGREGFDKLNPAERKDGRGCFLSFLPSRDSEPEPAYYPDELICVTGENR